MDLFLWISNKKGRLCHAEKDDRSGGGSGRLSSSAWLLLFSTSSAASNFIYHPQKCCFSLPWVEIHKYMGLIYQHPFRRHKFGRFAGFIWIGQAPYKDDASDILGFYAPFPPFFPPWKKKTAGSPTAIITHVYRKEVMIWTYLNLQGKTCSITKSSGIINHRCPLRPPPRGYGKNMEPRPLNRLRVL